MTERRQDIIVVGAGVIGLLAARCLARSGAQVAVIDPRWREGPASWAGAGLLSSLPPWSGPQAVRELAERSAAAYPELCEELFEATGIDPELERRGVLWLDPEDAPDDAVLASFGAERLTPDAACSLLPGVRRPDRALLLPGVHTVRNPRLLQALRGDLARLAVAQVNAQVSAIERVGSLWVVTRADGAVEHAPELLLAAGAWTRGLLASVGYELPVEPVRGQILLMRCAQPLAGPVVLQGDSYVVPRRDGHLLVGSTVEAVGFEPHTTAAGLAALRAAYRELLPGVPAEEVGAWAGLRPGSPDGVPWIGPVPGQEDLFVCTGHFRMGLTMAPGSAALICELMLGGAVAPEYALPAQG